MLEFFESLNDTRDFLFWNSKQGTGEWLLLRKLFGTFFTSKWLSPEWVLGRFWECLIQKMTWNILYKGGEGEFFWKWLLPKNGFSPKMASPQKMASPRKWLLLGNNFSPGNSKYIKFYFIFVLALFWKKNLTPVAKVGLINILYQNIRYCQEKVIDPGQFVCLCLLNDLNLHGVPNIVCSIMIINKLFT